MKLIWLILLLSNTVDGIEYKPLFDEELPDPAYKITLDDDGNWLELTVDIWVDVIHTDAGKLKRKYAQGYNYHKKQGFMRVYDLDGKLLSEVYGVDYDGSITKEEMLLAFDLFKAHPTVQGILQKEQGPIELFGGFTYADKGEDQPCSRGLRCVHIFANNESKPIILHSIVRLTDRTIPYPTYNHHLRN